MIKGIQAIRNIDLSVGLEKVLLPRLVELLQSRGKGHCMRVSDLDEVLMIRLCRALRTTVPESLVYILSESEQDGDAELGVSSTKLIEQRNPDEKGQLRPPLMVFVPNNIKTSSEDSFGIATFEQVEMSDAYRLLFTTLVDEMPNELQTIVAEVHYLLSARNWQFANDYQWCRYALTLKVNDFDLNVIGAALYEVGLIPDLTLQEDNTNLARKLSMNQQAVNLVIECDKSPIACVYDLQLENDDFIRQLASYLNQQSTLQLPLWLRNIVLDSSNWNITFDKWRFKYEQRVADALCIEVTDVGLPVIPETEQDSQLQRLMGQKVLTIGDGGTRKFGVTFSTDPAPGEVQGLAKFKAQVFTQQGDFVGLIKAGKAGKKKTITINFTRLNGIVWEEGWHYVRIQAFDLDDELIPLIDQNKEVIPWGTAREEEAGSRPNESELFYVLPAIEVDIEPIQTRRPKEDNLAHAKLKLQFAAQLEQENSDKIVAKEVHWLEGASRTEEILDVQFGRYGGVHISVPRVLKSLEQKIITDPLAALTWRLELELGELQKEPVIECGDWPIAGVEEFYQAFVEARQAYLQTIGQGEMQLISVGNDFRGIATLANNYAQSYMVYLSALYQQAEQSDDSSFLDQISFLLRLDAVTITLWDYHGHAKQTVLLGPTHPLRVQWLSGWSQLSEYWLNLCKGQAKEVVLGSRNGLLNELSLANFPYVLPFNGGQLLVALDNLHPYWTVYGPAQEGEPQTLLDNIATGLGFVKPELGQQVRSGDSLAAKVERYLVQHPYIHTLTINVFNAGRASAITDMLLALEKRKELKRLKYDIRLFVADPYTAYVGADLLELLSIEGNIKSQEADVFITPTESHLRPKLSVSVRAINDFLQNVSLFTAHLSMLFDVFPAEEVAVVTQSADERIAPIHGLYQDYCVEYSEENGVVAWDRYTRHGSAKSAFGNDFTDTLSGLPALMSTITASIATGKFTQDLVPVIKLALDADQRALLNQLHEVSDWVFTIDRNLGIEFFDHGGKDNRPDYLIDHSPEMAANNGHNFVITSRSTTEIEALLKGALTQHHLVSDPIRATRILDALRALSGRLALKLISSSASKSEALGLALAKMYLEYQGVFRNQIIVPLDAHLELYQELQKTADELGDSISMKRTDLALFDLDSTNQTIRCNLVEVKCYSDVGDLSTYMTLKEKIALQISQSERVLQQHFDPHRTAIDRPDRLIRTQKLCVLLEYYLKRSQRFNLLDPDVVDEAKYLLRTLEDGYKLVFSRNAIIFDFESDGTGVDTELGIEYHRIGKNHINELLKADESSSIAIVEGTKDYELMADATEKTLAQYELTLPKLTDAAFISRERDRTVSWDDLVKRKPTEFSLLKVEKVIGESNANEVGLEKKTNVIQTESKDIREPKVTASNERNNAPECTNGSESKLDVETPKDTSSIQPLDKEKVDVCSISGHTSVKHNVVLGVNGDSAQFGLLGEIAGRKVALDLNHTHTISLFGVQGGGKSYTLGTVVEMATMPIPAINQLTSPLATVIFHYSSTQDYKPEFTSMIRPNDVQEQLLKLKDIYGAEPGCLNNIVLLTPEDKLELRRDEYPDIVVHPLKFCSSELQASHWKFLMGAVGNQANYIRQLTQIMRRNRNNLTLESIRTGVDNSNMSDQIKELAMMRLEFAGQYIDDDVNLSELIRPGRMIIVDLRDEFIEKDEALGLFVVLLQIFSEAKYNGQSFNKLIVFDECHKYIDSPDLVKGLVEVVREMRHKGTSVMIASQDPLSVPIELIELSSQIILHKFNSPAWLKHIQKANAALGNLTAEKLASLQPGEAYVWSSKASDNVFCKEALKIKCRPRVTKHGGDTLTAIS